MKNKGTRRVVPLAAERVRLGRRRVVTGRVRIAKTVRRHEVIVDEPLVRDSVVVRRVPVNRFVDGPVPDRVENGVLIVSLLEEVPTVVKRLRVVEELHVRRRVERMRRPRLVMLRRQDVVVQRLPGERTGTNANHDNVDPPARGSKGRA